MLQYFKRFCYLCFSTLKDSVIYASVSILARIKGWEVRWDRSSAKVEMPGIEPGTSYMQSMRSTTELHPHDWKENFFLCWAVVNTVYG